MKDKAGMLALRRGIPCALLGAFVLAGCQYTYPRTIEDGELRMTVLRADGKPAASALARIPGTERVAAADADGVVSLKGLPAMAGTVHVVLDDDGDGVAEEAALVPFLTELKPVRKNISDGITTEAKVVVTGLLLGDVTLQETGSVSGTVTEDGAALGGRLAQVALFRVARVGAVDGNGGREVTLPVEASATAALDGSFTIPGVLPGDLRVLALVRTDDAAADKLAFARASLGDTAVALDATTALPATTPMQLELIGATDRTTLDTVFFLQPGTTTDLGDPAVKGEPAGTHVVDAPQGIFDLQAAVGDGPAGLAASLAAVNDNLPPWMPVELPVLVDPCTFEDAERKETVRDCDRDGLGGVEAGAGAAAVYDACAASCGGLVGAALDAKTCTVSGDRFDCDDDSDGVADVDERACVGPLRGTDLDSDGLCEPGADPFLLCSDNTAAACL